MNRNTFRVICLMLLILISANISFAQKNRTKRGSRNDKLITAMIEAEGIRGVWGDDAMYIFTTALEIDEIYALGKKAIPLLIEHLNDKRILSVTYFNMGTERQEAYEITIGAACFDLLNYIIRQDARFFDKSCLKGLGEEGNEGHASSCAKTQYGVFPEDFWAVIKQDQNGLWRGKNLVVPKSVRRAKRNWQIAYRKGWIHYEKFRG